MSESERRIFDQVETRDRVFSLVVDEHGTHHLSATRLSWWVGTKDLVHRRLTVLEAVEELAADGRQERPEMTADDAAFLAAEAIFNATFKWIVNPLVPAFPEDGTAARPFWNELVAAAARHPGALVQVFYEFALSRREEEG